MSRWWPAPTWRSSSPLTPAPSTSSAATARPPRPSSGCRFSSESGKTHRMSEPTEPSAAERPEIVLPQLASADGEVARESVEAPAKVMRIGSMIKQLLDEVRAAPLDEASRDRLAQIYETSVMELSESLSPDLQAELHRLVPPFTGSGTPPSGA